MINARSVTLLAALGLLAGSVAWATLGGAGAVLAIAAALLVSLFTYWGRSTAILRMLGARPLPWYEAPGLHELTADLARRAGVAMPQLYLLPGTAANAVAVVTGRGSAIGVSGSLLRHLPAEEVAAVIAHEIAHMQHRDLALAAIAGALAGAAAFLAEMGRWGAVLGWLLGLPIDTRSVVLALAVAGGVPLAALLLRMAFSREREYLADAGAAELTGSPELVARALWRLEQVNRGPWWLRLFRMTPAEPRGFARLLTSHPPTRERIARLMAMAPARAAAHRGWSSWTPAWRAGPWF